MSKNGFFSTTEAAKILGISRIAVFNRVKRGSLKAIRIGKNWAIPKEELENNLGRPLSEEEKRILLEGVRKVIAEYGETLRRLGKE
ncbi:MAG: helix-turn-helix domain-containing protein [Parcubacteria group bacterium]